MLPEVPFNPISDLDLVSLSECPLKNSNAQISPIYDVALKTATRVLVKSMEAVPSRREIRELFSSIWEKAFSEIPASTRSAEYWEGLKKAAHVAAALRQLMEKYSVILPNRKYVLKFSQWLSMNGKPAPDVNTTYVMLRKRKPGDDESRVSLIFHPHRPLNYFSISPLEAVRAYALHRFINTDGVADTDITSKPVVSLNVPLLRGEPWIHADLKMSRIGAWLSDLVATYGTDMPRPGSHCLTCIGRACLSRMKG